jgi:hypothetical protein
MVNSATLAPVGCHGATHVWCWSQNSTDTRPESCPEPESHCMCGALTWGQAQELLRIQAENIPKNT